MFSTFHTTFALVALLPFSSARALRGGSLSSSCCMAMHADCDACRAGLSVDDFCAQNPHYANSGCPPPTPALMCGGDGKTCPSGHVVGRNPDNNCNFYPCDPENKVQCMGKSIPMLGVSCGRGSNLPGGRCPSTHWCHVHPTDQFAVCCPDDPAPATKPAPVPPLPLPAPTYPAPTYPAPTYPAPTYPA